MLRSMFTAIGSLNHHQTYLDVIANNLANANTTGYKSSRVLFKDQFSQLLNPGSGPTANLGGINPTQVGLGVQVASITPVFTQGTLQSTGRNLDLSVQGDGLFMYTEGAEIRYSRAGSLTMDSGGYLVSAATGQRIRGWQATAGNVDTNLAPTEIQVITDRTVARATTTATFGGNLSSLLANGSPVDTTLGIYDTLGALHPVTVRFTRTNDTTWNWSVTQPTGAAGAGTITFTNAGQYASSTVTTAVNVAGSAGATNVTPTFDLTGLTMLASTSSISVSSQDGLPSGSVSDVNVSPNDGSIYLVYTNGMSERIAQLALARFSNPTGLIRSGNTSFKQGMNSGEPQIGVAGTGGRGTIAAGYLEASNVDMAQEFTSMILAQRGFQASSRVITTSDEVLQELVNLKR